jgi:DNA primase
MARKKVPISKERVLNVCKRINAGVLPSDAVHQEGLSHTYFVAMRDAGIVFKSVDGKTWQARMRIHDERYQKFLEKRKEHDAILKVNRVPRKRKVVLEPITTQKVGFFKRLWIKLFS